MSKITALVKSYGGEEKLIHNVIARDVQYGNTLSTSTEEPTILAVDRTACGIVNTGASQVTISVILCRSDHTQPRTVVIPAGGENTSVGLFNGIVDEAAAKTADIQYLIA